MSFGVVALIALLAMILTWLGMDILLAEGHIWLEIGITLTGLWMALAALTTGMGALDLARLPDPLLEIGPAGLRDQLQSPDLVAWADLEWHRIAVMTPYGMVDQVQIRLNRP
ncbi:hypothetical protein [Devosia enhydra]|uniref:hypothetical protein n=1 Tax=Devosia enhydra TaxID=665118 RepID=UPI00093000A9|nr:hypothetical protein [Devosia enhydra]